jgi:hypothetical protein
MAKRMLGRQRLVIKHIKAGARNLLLPHRFDQCRFIDNWPARGVELVMIQFSSSGVAELKVPGSHRLKKR